jgi:parallel beta-helix repeat protein
VNPTVSKRPLFMGIGIGAIVVALIAVAVWAFAEPAGKVESPYGEHAGPVPETSEPTDEAEEPAATPPSASSCSDSATVTTAEELEEALAGAQPGTAIVLAPGRYVGNFVATVSGTADAPIRLCGPADAVLDGDGTQKGYVFHLDGAQYWQLSGFTVTNGQKGVMADTTVGSVISGLTVNGIGDEAIHLRNFSTDNQVLGNRISDTGLRKEKFGEGIYIGTAESNWCDFSDCKPDNSDRNLIEGNTISGTSAESIDLKEGTSDGIVRGNTFDGAGITGGDSWVDVKGNGYLIEGNTGTNSPQDGFQTHEILDGWGTNNVFRGNTAEVNGPGFGYSLTPERDNVVECSNAASGAGEGVTNVTCSG